MDIVLRATVMFFALFALLRLTGKRELSEMTPFDLVLLVVMGDLVQQGVTHNDFSLTGAALAAITFAFWAVAMSWLSYLSPRAERLLDGEPVVVVRDGTLIKANLARDRLTPSEVESEMRLAGIARIKDVEWAILETNGKISFIARPGAGQPGRQQDERPPG